MRKHGPIFRNTRFSVINLGTSWAFVSLSQYKAPRKVLAMSTRLAKATSSFSTLSFFEAVTLNRSAIPRHTTIPSKCRADRIHDGWQKVGSPFPPHSGSPERRRVKGSISPYRSSITLFVFSPLSLPPPPSSPEEGVRVQALQETTRNKCGPLSHVSPPPRGRPKRP